MGSQIITLQIGQCGNQVGKELYDLIMQETIGSSSRFKKNVWDTFFRPSVKKDHRWIARSVLVDMEPKVISQTIVDAKKSGSWMYDESRQYSKQSGSANNWAHGYRNQMVATSLQRFNTHGPSCEEAVLELIRKEVEMCDSFGGFFVTLSLAGGTGSGVGTYFCDAIKDAYSSSFIIAQPVWPFETGEVIVQNYNAILSLSHLYQSTDAIIVIENDQLHSVCTKLLNIKKVSFNDMNKVVAHALSNIFLPSYHWDSAAKKPSGIPLRWFVEPMAHLCSHPQFKLLNMKTIPMMPQTSLAFSSYLWSGLLKHLHQMLLADAKIEEDAAPVSRGQYRRPINKSLANVLTMRGCEVEKADPSAFFNPDLYTSWSMDPIMVSSHPKQFKKYEKSATLLRYQLLPGTAHTESNSQTIINPLNKIVDKAYEMFLSKAFLHQYQKHKLQEDDFSESFVQLEQVLENYKNL